MPKSHHAGSGTATLTGCGADPTARLRAVTTTRDMDALAEALNDTSPDVARAAIRRLVDLDPALAAPLLRTVLLDVDLTVTVDLAKALRELDDSETIALACAGLVDELYTRRVSAAVTLGVFAEGGVRPDLRRALGDPIAAVRTSALEALSRVGPDSQSTEQAAELLSDTSAQVRAAAVRLVAGRHPHDGELLSAMVGDPDLQVRCELARHLGRLSTDGARRLLADRDEGVRCQAAGCANAEHTVTLGRLLTGDSQAEVRRAAARALGGIGGQAAAEELIAGIEDSDAVVRLCVLHALERALTRQGAIARLVEEVDAARARRRRWTLYGLSQLTGHDHDHTTLIWKLADDPDLDVRLAVLGTASTFLLEPEPLLMYMRTDQNVEVRESAARRLEGRSS